MTRFYVPRQAGARETMGALAVALSVGSLSFYLVRMFLTRENLETDPPAHVAGEPESRPSSRDQGARQ